MRLILVVSATNIIYGAFSWLVLKGATKSYRKITFVSATKIDENTTKILKLLFLIINLNSVHIKPNIYIWKTEFVSHKQYLSRLLTSRNAKKKTRTDQSIPRVFLPCLKRNDPQTFKSDSCKNPFLQCVCYCYNLLR